MENKSSDEKLPIAKDIYVAEDNTKTPEEQTNVAKEEK